MKSYPTARPYIGKKEERYVLQALRSGKLSIGPFIEKFEKKFAKTLGVKHAIAVSSGTGGLHLALIAAGIRPGDEVITSPFSFVASANSILYVGATPVFADIEPDTFNIDPKEIDKKITLKTRSIMPVHIFGQPAKMDEIMKIAKKHKLVVIEDACEALLSTYKGNKAGTFGQSAVFAFYANKQMTTGEGGMIVTSDDRIAELCRSLRNQGRAPNMQWLDHDRLGYNYRMDEMSAALGLAQLENIRFLIKKRQELARWYTDALKPLAAHLQLPAAAKDATHTWFVYVVALKNKRIDRDRLIERLKKKGVHAKPYLPSIHLFEFYRSRGHRAGECPISEDVSRRTFALPFYVGLRRKDVARIAAIVQDVLTSHEK
ncbi:DegT/DnrJ/EryC1/StrS family aminotransferase [Candidatus Kaiserbacteria bacterium]|nr:DegT/DnrJ/EryC1/StrS family aminotransferase [Candidatus Kaiserbacteria bacterium]